MPLLPAFLAFISGVENDDDSVVARRKIIISALFFVIGFTFVFTFFGLLAGLAGGAIGPLRTYLTQLGGIFIIFFGLLMLGVFRLSFLSSDHKIKLPASVQPGHPSSSFFLGAGFAVGWTPCVGPVLASVLLLASTSSTAFSGAFLLLVFSAGLAVPFLVTAFLYSRASSMIAKYSYVSKFISQVGGVFLLFLGVLLLTDNFGLILEYGYALFGKLGLSGLFEHF